MFSTEELYVATIIGSLFIGGLVTIIIVTTYFYYIRRRQNLLDRYELENALLLSQVEIQEQTFKTISQEIHDNIGQILTLVKLHLNTVNFQNLEQAEAKIAESKALVSQSLSGLRDLSKTLHKDTISSLGFHQALKLELGRIERLGIVSVKFQCNGELPDLTPNAGIIVFRIIQESLQNILKHSQATEVNINVSDRKLYLEIIIEDNGIGVSNLGFNNSGGSGMRNICDRAKIISANVKYDCSLSGGLKFILEIPYHATNFQL